MGEDAYLSATSKLDEGEFQADSAFGKVRVTSNYLTGAMHGNLRDYTHYNQYTDKGDERFTYRKFTKDVEEIQVLVKGEAKDRKEWTEKYLQAQCVVRNLDLSMKDKCVDKDGMSLALDVNETTKTFTCPTWRQY